MKYFVWLAGVLLLNACAFHRGDLDTNIPDEPVEHRDMAIGVATTVKVFGIGSTNKDALIHEARQKMVMNRPLEGNEAYNNITTDVKNTWFLCVNKQKVTMTADVIAPKENESDPTYTEHYLSKLKNDQSIYDTLFQIGDSVLFQLDKYGEVVGFEGQDGRRVRIKYTKYTGEVKSISVHGTNVFMPIENYRGKREVGKDNEIGPMIAFGIKHDLYRSKAGSHFKFKRSYSQVWKD